MLVYCQKVQTGYSDESKKLHVLSIAIYYMYIIYVFRIFKFYVIGSQFTSELLKEENLRSIQSESLGRWGEVVGTNPGISIFLELSRWFHVQLRLRTTFLCTGLHNLKIIIFWGWIPLLPKQVCQAAVELLCSASVIFLGPDQCPKPCPNFMRSPTPVFCKNYCLVP